VSNEESRRYSLLISLLISIASFRMTKAKVSLYRILHTVLVIPSAAKESKTVES